MSLEFLSLLMVVCVFAALLVGYPVAFTLAGVSLLWAFFGHLLGVFNISLLHALPGSIYGIMTSDLLIAVPLFVFMGMILERSKIAEELLEMMEALSGNIRGGLGISVIIVGAMLAASTGIVGATVVTMGMISLPTMLKSGYNPSIASGTICASGTLGQIIPPSIVLILLADQMSNSWQNVQLDNGIISPIPMSISDLFVAALVPGLLLVVMYMLWQSLYSIISPGSMPQMDKNIRQKLLQENSKKKIFLTLAPPLLLIIMVLGSILGGIATATESASIGAGGAMLLAAFRKMLNRKNLKHAVLGTMHLSSMVFMILIGASFFTLVFRGYGGDDMVAAMLSDLPGGLFAAMFVSMFLMFLLGFFLDFIQIIFVMVPIISPILLGMGADPIWLAIMIAVNLQTSFLTPPFGFALFYLRGVAPSEVKTSTIYKGAIPFVFMQIIMLFIIAFYPRITTFAPDLIYDTDFREISASISLHKEKEPDRNNQEELPSWAIDF